MLVNQKILMRIFRMIVKSVIYQLTIVNRKIIVKIILMIVNQKITMKIYQMMVKILIYLLLMKNMKKISKQMNILTKHLIIGF
jgi:hypothetical protein